MLRACAFVLLGAVTSAAPVDVAQPAQILFPFTASSPLRQLQDAELVCTSETTAMTTKLDSMTDSISTCFLAVCLLRACAVVTSCRLL